MSRIMNINGTIFIDGEQETKDEFVREVIQFFYLNDDVVDRFVEFRKVMKDE